MKKIYSKVNGNLLHMVKRKSDIKSERENLSSDLEFLQCSQRFIIRTSKLDVYRSGYKSFTK